MPWLAPDHFRGMLEAEFERADSRGAVLSVHGNGASFDFCRPTTVGYDFIIRVQDDPSVECISAIKGVLKVLGIERDIGRVRFKPASVEARDPGVVNRGTCGYAVPVREFGHEHGCGVPPRDDAESELKSDYDSVLRLKDVGVATDVQEPHGTSLSADVVGTHSVGDEATEEASRVSASASKVTRASEPLSRSPWMTVPEAAKYARCGTKRIYDACRTGDLIATQEKAPHGTWRIHVDDLDNYLGGAKTRRNS